MVFGFIHAVDEHTGNLGSDLVVGHTVGDFVVVIIWQKAEKVVVYAIEVLSMLP